MLLAALQVLLIERGPENVPPGELLWLLVQSWTPTQSQAPRRCLEIAVPHPRPLPFLTE